MMSIKNIFLGRVVKPFGIKGEVKLLPSDDFWEVALESKKLYFSIFSGESIREVPVSLMKFRKHGATYVLVLDGVCDRTQAESLVGAELFIPYDSGDVEFPDELLPCQILGCKVITDEGDCIGYVSSLIFSPAHRIYEVTGETGVNLIPAVPEFILSENMEEEEIVIKTIPGLLSEDA